MWPIDHAVKRKPLDTEPALEYSASMAVNVPTGFKANVFDFAVNLAKFSLEHYMTDEDLYAVGNVVMRPMVVIEEHRYGLDGEPCPPRVWSYRSVLDYLCEVDNELTFDRFEKPAAHGSCYYKPGLVVELPYSDPKHDIFEPSTERYLAPDGKTYRPDRNVHHMHFNMRTYEQQGTVTAFTTRGVALQRLEEAGVDFLGSQQAVWRFERAPKSWYVEARARIYEVFQWDYDKTLGDMFVAAVRHAQEYAYPYRDLGHADINLHKL